MSKVSTAAQTGVLIPGPGALKASAIQAGLISLSSEQQEMVNKAKKYAMEQSIKSVLTKQSLAHQQQQQKSLQRHQALVLMCRVYVGSISFELKEDTIRQAFITFGPIKSINMSWDPVTQKHKGFAFVEYELPEAAQLALDLMNGIMLGGRNIKVGRPSNMPQAAPIIQQITEEAKDHNRVYVASIRQDLSEQDVQTVFGAFGVIKSCKLAQSGTASQHKGYGFIEYENEQSVTDAVTAMQNFDLGGQSLKVGRATTPPENLSSTGTIANPVTTPTSASMLPVGATSPSNLASNGFSRVLSTSPLVGSVSIPPGGSTSPPPSQEQQLPPLSQAQLPPSQATTQPTLPQQPIPPSDESNLVLTPSPRATSPSNANILLMRMLRRYESRVCVLKNMVSIKDVDDDLKRDVSDECGQYGQLVSVVIYIDLDDVKIFVEFLDSSSAEKAKDSLDGRFFGGRKVIADIYDQSLFDACDYTG